MKKLARTQVSVLASYSSPFVFLVALAINIILSNVGELQGFARLMLLSLSAPIGFAIGRVIYLRRSHVEIQFDDEGFQVKKGSRYAASGNWRSYKLVSITLDQFRRASIRLYKSLDGESVDIPVSKTNADPQEFRDYVQKLISSNKSVESTLQLAEAS